MDIYRVGMLHFSDHFGQDLLDRLNTLTPFYDDRGNHVKIAAEHLHITELSLDYSTPYQLIVDQRSHNLDQAVGILNIFAFRGVKIINNPFSFHYFIKRKDLGYAMIRDLGIPVPETFILPLHTSPDLGPGDFKFHHWVNWGKIARRIGFPCLLKPSDGRGASGVCIVNNMDELITEYNKSGSRLMMIQAHIRSPHPWHVRCLCIGRNILPIKFEFGTGDQSRYIFDKNFLEPDIQNRMIEYSQIINRTIGYDVNSVEFIIDADGIPWAIDFTNPVPDSRREVLGEIYYEHYLSAMGDLVRDTARKPHPQFLPDLNHFAEIARSSYSKEEKIRHALALTADYYQRK